ncbi:MULTISPECIES: ABC transporter substrate-binding protein [unclassified Pseudonocardia]|uniref:ABC transporter substrate-binding protein n=1 Tax=unclassified Pseudonocardia TaxID=2619320 RepID=UPI00095F3EC2|nr:ABC transporter substrate-binding protein [Pseudonocardia sp. Ae707_Ps1]OLM21422.1 putative solute binding protein of ABC transporter system [Pseudonocardia sp. Ae707_Ps1]
MTRLRRRRARPFAGLAVAAVLALAGCGVGGDGSGGRDPAAGAGVAPGSDTPLPAVARDDALAARVPAAVRADGVLTVGVEPTYPPNEFTAPDGSTVVGMSVDLGTAVAAKLGLGVRYETGQFSGIIPGVQGGRYEAGMSSFTINPERSGVVDMVSYFSAGTSLVVAAGNPEGITPDDLCGRPVGVQAGTTQTEEIVGRDEACVAAGREPIRVTELLAQTDVTLALVANRVDAMLADSPVASYAVTQSRGTTEIVGRPYDTAPYGIVLPKDGELSDPVRAALQELIDDGTYRRILDRWNVGDGAITTSEVGR